MAPSDDEIPDLFPGASPARPAAPPARARESVSPSAPVRRKSVAPPAGPSASVRPPAPRASSPPPRASSPPVAPRPSSLPPGETSGLEIDDSWREERAGRGTAVVGTPDDALEFDPSSVRRPSPQDMIQARSPSGPRPARRTPSPASPTPASAVVGELDFGDETMELEASISSVPPSPAAACVRPSARPSSPPGGGLGQARQSPVPQRQPSGAPSSSPGAMSESARVAPSALSAPAVPNPASLGLPSLGGEVELGDGLDDLGLGGADMAQLNVAIPTHEPGDEVAWPIARTPELDEVDLDEETISELAAFGPTPESVFAAPLYFIRVSLALGAVRQACEQTEKALRDQEHSRDEKLAKLAEKQKRELQHNDRFRSLYSTVERHDQNIVSKRTALSQADSEGADELRQVQAKIESLASERTVKEAARDEQLRIFRAHELKLQRARAIVARTGIELRNLEERRAQGVDFGVVDFETRQNAQLREKESAEAVIAGAQKMRPQFEARLEEAEDELRQVVAHLQAHEAQKEGLLLAFEGELSDRSRELDEAIKARQSDLANAARVIFELRGEVKVEADVRRDLLAADEAVREAFIAYAQSRAALQSMDEGYFRLGRAICLALALGFVLLLVAGAII